MEKNQNSKLRGLRSRPARHKEASYRTNYGKVLIILTKVNNNSAEIREFLGTKKALNSRPIRPMLYEQVAIKRLRDYNQYFIRP